MVLSIVPLAMARSLLLSAMAPSPQVTRAKAWGVVPGYVNECLSIEALEALLKLQGAPVLVLRQESAGHPTAGTGRPAPHVSADALAAPSTRVGDARAGDARAGDDRLDEVSLSPREMEILALVVEGVSNNELSKTLSISCNTVESHMRSIMRKLRTTDRNQTAVVGRIIFGGSFPGESGAE